jgi:hypothetical protein
MCSGETDTPTSPGSGPGAAGGAGGATQPCPLNKCEPTVTIERVRRGNPYVSKNADPADGMPDSVPPTKTYEVEVTVSPCQPGCPGHTIDLSIINTSADNGTATVSPAQITTTTKVTVTGGTQTKPGHGGNLKIQAKLSGTVKAESAGFSVCAHPIDFTDTYHSDVYTATRLGVRVQDGWSSDSGTFADLDETEISEVVSYTGTNNSPPFPARGAVGANNSGYLPGDALTVDTHSIGRGTITLGTAGVTEAQQLSIFKCKRCGATDKVHPHSGFTRIHEVFKVGAQWKHRTRKFGAAVTIGAHTTEAATGNVTSPDHDLP